MTRLASVRRPPAARTYEIHEVAALTGLAAARLRAWERRYQVVRPHRLPNGYRVYTGDQVSLLRAYARLIGDGERIGELAAQPVAAVLARAEIRKPDDSPHGALLDAVRALDRERLETLVAGQLALRGLDGFAREVALPLGRAIGDAWAAGDLPIAAEHLATEVVVSALKGGLRLPRGAGPLLLAAGLPGERHEWGLLATLAGIQERGWRVTYLGPDMPVDQVALAAWSLAPAAVALSASRAEVVGASLSALAALRDALPGGTVSVIGGAGAAAHRETLYTYGFLHGIEALMERSS